MKFQGIQRMKALLAATAIGIALAGCSAGGKGTDTTSTATTASSLSVSASKSSINSTGTDAVTITVTALNSSNNVVASAPVSISPDSGVLTASGTSTSAAGVLTGTLTVGSDHTNRTINVVVTSGSIKKTLAIAVTGDTLSATVGSTTAGSPATIQYSLVDAANVAIPNEPITVTLSGQAAVAGTTDANGKYTFSYTMPSASTTVTAVAAGVTTTSTATPTNGTTVIGPAGSVTSASLAANPTSVSTGAQSELRALFIGASNAPIQNVRVHFMLIDTNSIGGSLSTDASDGTHNVVYSDGNGVARSTYTGGTRGGVITPAMCWSPDDFTTSDCTGANEHSVSASSLTVVASGVNLAWATNGLISENDTQNTYSLSIVVTVVDASSQPISGSTVTGSVDIPTFYRGIYGLPTGATSWVPGIYVRSGAAGSYSYALSATVARQPCDNEDINRNNVLETGEDVNGSGALEPYKASVTIVPTSTGSNVTDVYGKAYFTLQYGQNYASWEDVVATFTTTVEGTEGHAQFTSSLPVPASVLTTTTTPPVFQVSPYNLPLDGLDIPWIVGTAPVANPGVIYPSTTTFNLCKPQQ
jgi:uncharacterized MnhB-related membrane protein